jgi:hypothetical protein
MVKRFLPEPCRLSRNRQGSESLPLLELRILDIELYIPIMKITAIIEKGTDGMYSIRSEQHFDGNYFGGFGESVTIAKEDFIESIQEALTDAKAEGYETEDSYTVNYHYDLPSFFNDFDFINASKFAKYVGINESKMRQYKGGTAYPSEKIVRKILDAIHRIGSEFSSVSL